MSEWRINRRDNSRHRLYEIGKRITVAYELRLIGGSTYLAWNLSAMDTNRWPLDPEAELIGEEEALQMLDRCFIEHFADIGPWARRTQAPVPMVEATETPPKPKRPCKHCENPFVPKTAKGEFCSTTCRVRHHRAEKAGPKIQNGNVAVAKAQRWTEGLMESARTRLAGWLSDTQEWLDAGGNGDCFRRIAVEGKPCGGIDVSIEIMKAQTLSYATVVPHTNGPMAFVTGKGFGPGSDPGEALAQALGDLVEEIGEKHMGKPEALDFADTAELLGLVLGRTKKGGVLA